MTLKEVKRCMSKLITSYRNWVAKVKATMQTRQCTNKMKVWCLINNNLNRWLTSAHLWVSTFLLLKALFIRETASLLSSARIQELKLLTTNRSNQQMFLWCKSLVSLPQIVYLMDLEWSMLMLGKVKIYKTTVSTLMEPTGWEGTDKCITPQLKRMAEIAPCLCINWSVD